MNLMQKQHYLAFTRLCIKKCCPQSLTQILQSVSYVAKKSNSRKGEFTREVYNYNHIVVAVQ